jgi:CheY-like chemotaxis protein
MLNIGKKKILILDDDTDVLELLRMRFEANGHEIHTGSNGLEGLFKVRKEVPDLVILDIMMPRLDGKEFFKIVKGNPKYAMTPVMVVTGKPDYKETFEKLGCDAFMTKPFEPGDLLGKAEALMKQRVLVAGDAEGFQEHVKASFPDDQFQVKCIDGPTQLSMEAAKASYHLAVVRLAQVTEAPETFMKKVRDASRCRDMTVIVYCDAYVKGVETNDQKVLSEMEVKWWKLENVLFYDPRITQPALSEFIKENF